MNWANVAGQVSTILLPVLLAGLSLASAKLAQYIHKKVQNEKLAGVLDKLDSLAFTVVASVAQTGVEAARDSSGKLPSSVAKDAMNAALAALKSHLGPKGLAEIEQVISPADITAFLVDHLESAVGSKKAEAEVLSNLPADAPRKLPDSSFGGAGTVVGALLCGLALSMTGCHLLTPAQKQQAVECAKEVGVDELNNAAAIVKALSADDWTAALEDILKAAGPGVLCEADIVAQVLKADVGAELAKAIGVGEAEIAKLEAWLAKHKADFKP